MDLRILAFSVLVWACSVVVFAQHEPAEVAQTGDLRAFTGTHQWGPNAFLYLRIWNELSGTPQLVAFDESGKVRSLYPQGNDRFDAGSKAGVEIRSRPRSNSNALQTGESPH